MKIKKYIELIEEGIFQNVLLSSLISLGVITSSKAGNIDKEDKNKIETIKNNQKDVCDFINFMKSNKIKLNKKYSFNVIKYKFEQETNLDFNEVLPKLNIKKSPISASIFTFSSKQHGLTEIPVVKLDINISDKLMISFWDSGWFPDINSNRIGSNIIYKF